MTVRCEHSAMSSSHERAARSDARKRFGRGSGGPMSIPNHHAHSAISWTIDGYGVHLERTARRPISRRGSRRAPRRRRRSTAQLGPHVRCAVDGRRTTAPLDIHDDPIDSPAVALATLDTRANAIAVRGERSRPPRQRCSRDRVPTTRTAPTATGKSFPDRRRRRESKYARRAGSSATVAKRQPCV
jgi:hypothetical protein